MKDLVEKVLAFRRKPEEAEVDELVWDLKARLGEAPSIPLLEEVVKRLKEEEKSILTGDLLEWMREHDLEEVEGEDFKVNIATYVSSKVEDSDAAFRWLEENQYGDLIKDTLDFQKGEFTPEAEHLLSEMGLSFTKKSGIHPQSLKKIMSDRLKSGDELPTEDDGIRINFYDECRVKEK